MPTLEAAGSFDALGRLDPAGYFERDSTRFPVAFRVLQRKLAHRAEERPRPSRLPLQRLREADQVARVSGVELDHSTGKKAIVGSDEASLRSLPVVGMRKGFFKDVGITISPTDGYQWSQAAHERAIQEAGFRTCTWYPSEVSPEDLAQYGEAYWQDWRENCLVIGLVCQK